VRVSIEVIICNVSDSARADSESTLTPAAKPGEAGEFQSGGVITLSLGHAVHDTYTAFLPPLLPAFIAKLALTRTEAGALTVFMQGPSVLQPLIGHLSGRVSLRYFVILTPAMTATMMSLLGIAPSYAVLALFLITVGLSSAALHAVVPVVAAHLSGRNLGRGMGFWMVGGELGRTLGPIIIVGAVNVLTLEGTAWLMTGGLLASLMLFVLVKDVGGMPQGDRPRVSFREGLRSMRWLLAPVAGIILVRALLLAALTIYLPMFLTEEGNELWFAGISLSVLEAAGVVGAFVGGSISDLIGRRAVLFISMVISPPFMGAFLMVDGWVRFPILLVLGFTTLSIAPVMMALVQESCAENRALANGVYMALSFVIRSGAVMAFGMIGDAFGLRLAFTISAVVPLAGLLFIPLLPAGPPLRPGSLTEGGTGAG
jgi:FSR family fosmidomycin resistance protein-like MFS transporter